VKPRKLRHAAVNEKPLQPLIKCRESAAPEYFIGRRLMEGTEFAPKSHAPALKTCSHCMAMHHHDSTALSLSGMYARNLIQLRSRMTSEMIGKRIRRMKASSSSTCPYPCPDSLRMAPPPLQRKTRQPPTRGGKQHPPRLLS